ncbi:MAG: hypothetical protein WD059_08900 [Balneolaceae bacterium]
MNTNDEGLTLLGNPFASSISFSEINNDDITGTLYIWDVNSSEGDGGEDIGENDPGAGSWKTNADGTGDHDGIIAPFQGFFVQNATANPTVTFTDGAKTDDGNFLGKQADKQLVRLELSGESMRNSAWLRFSENGAWDKTQGDALQLDPLSYNYALIASKKSDSILYDIGHVPVPESDFELPLAIEATKAGAYTLSATQLNLSAGSELYFEDRQENTRIKLDESFSYEFQIQQQLK